jgi:hypothetical protein
LTRENGDVWFMLYFVSELSVERAHSKIKHHMRNKHPSVFKIETPQYRGFRTKTSEIGLYSLQFESLVFSLNYV